MRVLVTGHLGYIGTILVPMLINEGHEVVGYDSDLYEECTFSDGIVPVTEIRKDIRDVAREDLEGIDPPRTGTPRQAQSRPARRSTNPPDRPVRALTRDPRTCT